MKKAVPKGKVATDKKTMWEDNSIQFPRLIAEADMAGCFTEERIGYMAGSMSLEPYRIVELINRAVTEYSNITGR